MRLETIDGVGAIPLGAPLRHVKGRMEMRGSEMLYGMPAHPLTISLTRESADRLALAGHDENWTLSEVRGLRITIVPARPPGTDWAEEDEYPFRLASHDRVVRIGNHITTDRASVEMVDEMKPSTAWQIARELLGIAAPDLPAMMVRRTNSDDPLITLVSARGLTRRLNHCAEWTRGQRRRTLAPRPLREISYRDIDQALCLMAERADTASGAIVYPGLYCGPDEFARQAGVSADALFQPERPR